MRFLGFEISFKRQSRWVPTEKFLELSQVVYALSEDVRSAVNGVAAGKKRMDRHLGKEEAEPTPEPKTQTTAQKQLFPGDILTPDEVAQIEGRQL